MRWVASQLSVPAIGFMCSDQRQPGAQVPAIAEWSPIFTTCTSPFPDMSRVSSGFFAFLISSPATSPPHSLVFRTPSQIPSSGGVAWRDWIRTVEIEPSLYAADFANLGEQVDVLLRSGARIF